MKIQKKREIVIEFERVQLVRRKARTHLSACRSCGLEVDFICLNEAVALFDAQRESLLHFVRLNRIHFETAADGVILICLVSLLTTMRAKTNLSQIKLIGD